jgi:hypothetical protein
MIEAAAEDWAASQPDLDNMSKSERLEYHRKKLEAVAYFEGVEGVAQYKKEHPDAAELGTTIVARAYRPKPSNYTASLVQMVENWLTMWVAVSSTNKEDVERLNARLDRSFNPANHFSAPLSKPRLEKIRAVFAKHGAALDTDRVRTMSQVRQAAKVHWAHTNADKPFGNVGLISGRDLVIGDDRFPIEKNGDTDCIRVQIRGKRRRFSLDDILWLAELLDGAKDPLNTTTVSSIGDLAYSPEASDNQGSVPPENSGLAYRISETSELGQRIARLREVYQPHSTTTDDKDDPLTRLDM